MDLFPIIITGLLGVIASIITYIVTKSLDNDHKIKEEIREIQRKRYEEFIDEMEDALQIGLENIRDSTQNMEVQRLIHKKLNKLAGKMFISAPDEIIKLINSNFSGTFLAEKRKEIYFEMRKKLLGKTELSKDDLLWFSETGNYE